MSERILEALVDGTHPEHGVVREWALLVYSVLWEGMMVTDDANVDFMDLLLRVAERHGCPTYQHYMAEHVAPLLPDTEGVLPAVPPPVPAPAPAAVPTSNDDLFDPVALDAELSEMLNSILS